MKLLAVDTSCDESCVAIFDTDQWSLLADVVHSHVDKMKPFGGIVPEIASREHLKALPRAVDEALVRAKLSLDEIDWYVVTHRPGLIGALLVGVSYIKALAFARGKPFSVSNHLESHLYSARLASTRQGAVAPTAVPDYPWIALVVSGGHTELYKVESDTSYAALGGTLDDAAGEAFDKVGKLLGMSYPAGPEIDRWVREEATAADRRRFSFPRARTEGLDFSFSGLKTAVLLEIKKLPAPLSAADKLAVAASAQEAILEALVDKFQLARARHGISAGVVTGGVACNSRLRELLPGVHFPAPRHCTDNAAMVALLAGLKWRQGLLTPSPLDVTAIP